VPHQRVQSEEASSEAPGHRREPTRRAPRVSGARALSCSQELGAVDRKSSSGDSRVGVQRGRVLGAGNQRDDAEPDAVRLSATNAPRWRRRVRSRRRQVDQRGRTGRDCFPGMTARLGETCRDPCRPRRRGPGALSRGSLASRVSLRTGRRRRPRAATPDGPLVEEASAARSSSPSSCPAASISYALSRRRSAHAPRSREGTARTR
jgi:hypothetical protein